MLYDVERPTFIMGCFISSPNEINLERNLCDVMRTVFVQQDGDWSSASFRIRAPASVGWWLLFAQCSSRLSFDTLFSLLRTSRNSERRYRTKLVIRMGLLPFVNAYTA